MTKKGRGEVVRYLELIIGMRVDLLLFIMGDYVYNSNSEVEVEGEYCVLREEMESFMK